MSLYSKTLKGTVVLSVGQLLSQSLSFARNIIVARLLSPVDMGIAATFLITITLLEMATNMAADMLLIQATDGDEPDFQATAHLYQVLKGIIVGIIIFISAPFIAELFKVPEALWAYQLVSIVPVLRGFMHLDWRRLQRDMLYLPALYVEMIPQFFIVILAWPFVIYFGDYSALLWLIILQVIISLIVSHCVAKRVYLIKWNRRYGLRIYEFGWPLLLNGILLFFIFEGDKLIIGSEYSMFELGVFTIAFNLAITVSTVVGKMITALTLPILSKVKNNEQVFQKYYKVSVKFTSAFAVIISLPFILIGENLIHFIYGEKYLMAGEFISWMGVGVLIRTYRLVPTIAAIAKKDTKNSLISNLFRLVGLVGAVMSAWYNLPIVYIVMSGVVGEFFALLASVYRLKVLHNINIFTSLRIPVLVSLLFSAVVVVRDILDYGDIVNYLLFFVSIISIILFILPEVNKFILGYKKSQG